MVGGELNPSTTTVSKVANVNRRAVKSVAARSRDKRVVRRTHDRHLVGAVRSRVKYGHRPPEGASADDVGVRTGAAVRRHSQAGGQGQRALL